MMHSAAGMVYTETWYDNEYFFRDATGGPDRSTGAMQCQSELGRDPYFIRGRSREGFDGFCRAGSHDTSHHCGASVDRYSTGNSRTGWRGQLAMSSAFEVSGPPFFDRVTIRKAWANMASAMCRYQPVYWRT